MLCADGELAKRYRIDTWEKVALALIGAISFIQLTLNTCPVF